jgi:hypothetical protein
MNHSIFGMLAVTGRMTMLGLSRWTEKYVSYRAASSASIIRRLDGKSPALFTDISIHIVRLGAIHPVIQPLASP